MKQFGKDILSDYGMLVVLVLLVLIVSLRTIEERHAEGAEAGREVAAALRESFPQGSVIVIAGRATADDRQFAAAVERGVQAFGGRVAAMITAGPQEARAALEDLVERGERIDAIACVNVATQWGPLVDVRERFPDLGQPVLVSPRPRMASAFFTPGNLLNVAYRITDIGIIAIGMTMVIITAGIDLSVGSLIALSSVVATWLIKHAWGGQDAAAGTVLLACCAGIAVCGALGLFSGSMVAYFRVPAFIVTLGVMLMASGLAFIISDSRSIADLPAGFDWLGRGSTFGIPNAVLLMLALFGLAHILMSRTALGRYIYAVGGNPEAARLSGVPVRFVMLFVYTVTGLLAGLIGIVTASKLVSGDPTYGDKKELEVIAAVVVGGTTLAGGEGKILGTLIGALIIGVIGNGMNLEGIESNAQRTVLGAVILGAALIDQLKKRAWKH